MDNKVVAVYQTGESDRDNDNFPCVYYDDPSIRYFDDVRSYNKWEIVMDEKCKNTSFRYIINFSGIIDVDKIIEE